MNIKSVKKSEKELVTQAQAGDFKSFSKLIENYRPKIFGLALKLAKNREDAEDILQETFLKAIDKIQQFRGESSFGTWLYAITVNITRAKYSREKQHDLLPIEDYLPSKHGHPDGDIPQLFDWKDPLSELTSDEVAKAIDQAIHRLPLKYRIPFLLRFIEELPVREVARTLKISQAAAKSRILRARLAVRHSLNDFFYEGGGNG